MTENKYVGAERKRGRLQVGIMVDMAVRKFQIHRQKKKKSKERR